MNIIEVDANLLEYQLDAFAHCCNCFNTFGAGIAASIKKKYPEAYQADLSFGESGDRLKLGQFSYVKTYDEKYIYNLYGQYTMGTHKRQLNYEAIYNAMQGMKKHAGNNSVRLLGFPRNMGCALAGGDWRIVDAMIRSLFEGDDNFEIYICNYVP